MCVYSVRPTIAIAKIRDYSQSIRLFAGVSLRDEPVSFLVISLVSLELCARVDDGKRARWVMGKREVRYSRQTSWTGHESRDGPTVLNNQIEEIVFCLVIRGRRRWYQKINYIKKRKRKIVSVS